MSVHLYFHSYTLQAALGELQMEIGAYATALEIFDGLSLWDPLIVCCQRAGRHGKVSGLNNITLIMLILLCLNNVILIYMLI